MTLIRPSLDYTAKDFDSLHARLFSIIPSAFPEWTDTQVANFGNMLVELFAYVGDVLVFYQDNQAEESRWSSAKLRRSILSMAKLIRYQPKGISAATTQLLVQLTAPPVGTVTIAVGDEFSTSDPTAPQTFRATAAVVIPAGANPPVGFVQVENASLATEGFISTELANQSYLLAYSPFIDASLVLSADNGSYTVVEDFLDSSATNRHVVLTVDENSRARITFGNGVSGAIPAGGIALTYKYGGGVVGNVASNSIRRVANTYLDSLGNPVTLSCSNPTKAAGGADVQSIESIRERAPRSIRATSRTVCREDYEINALRVAGIARALMITSNEEPTIRENQGILYVVPEGGGIASETLLNTIYDNLHAVYPKTITFRLTILSAVYLRVNIVAKIHLATGAKGPTVGARIKANLAAFFAINAADGSQNNNIDFGYYLDEAIAWSDVFNVVRDTLGVRKFDDGLGNLTLNGEADDLEIGTFRFPVIGTITVVNAATGEAL